MPCPDVHDVHELHEPDELESWSSLIVQGTVAVGKGPDGNFYNYGLLEKNEVNSEDICSLCRRHLQLRVT